MDDFDPATAALAVTDALRPLGTPGRAAQEKRYLKSDLEFIGVGVPDLRRVVKAAVRARPGLDPGQMVAWAVALWREPVHERRAAAVEILTLAAPRLAASDLATVERLLRGSRTWAYVDALAGNVAGEVALRDPAGAWPRVDAWAVDEDFWLRRSALLALLRGIRAGTPDLARFTRYAELMLTEKEFFVRKAIGWVLREISRRDPAWVAGWTADHLAEMSGVTFREAVRRLPAAEGEWLGRLRQRNADLGGLTVGRGRVKEQPPQPGKRPGLQPGDVHLGDAEPGGDLLLRVVAVKPHDEDPLLAAGQLAPVLGHRLHVDRLPESGVLRAEQLAEFGGAVLPARGGVERQRGERVGGLAGLAQFVQCDAEPFGQLTVGGQPS